MNLLKHYIKDILEETRIKAPEWSNDKWVKVKMIINCYGNVETVENIYLVDVWENIKKKGYYMG